MKIRYQPKVEGLFVMNYYLIEVAEDFEPKTKTKCSNFSVPKGGIVSAFAGWDLVGGLMVGHTGRGQEPRALFTSHQLILEEMVAPVHGFPALFCTNSDF